MEEEARKILLAKLPLGVPWIEPEDVVPVVVFLASDAAPHGIGRDLRRNRRRQRPQHSLIAAAPDQRGLAPRKEQLSKRNLRPTRESVDEPCNNRRLRGSAAASR